MKFAMSYSYGKDSALALRKMIEAGHEPVCLVPMFPLWQQGRESDVSQIIRLGVSVLDQKPQRRFAAGEPAGSVY